MKYFFSVILNFIAIHFLLAQSVGIGTTSPNPKALLDISSNAKGVLLPRMTTIERSFNIPSPPNGLLVYDTDKNEFYHYNGSQWSPILNGEYWKRPNSTHNRISNANDSVGIGLTTPTEWLDVDGNIRSRNSIFADNDINATGTIYGGVALATGGNMVVVGTSLLNGNATANANFTVNGTSTLDGNVNANANLTVDGTSLLDGTVTTNSDLIMNNSGATLQLKSSNVNKGFFQLSGDNVRLGTNSGNSGGTLIFRLNGSDRIVINSSGDIDLDGKITRNAVTGTVNLLPLCFGKVNTDGSILSGSGNFTVEKLISGSGSYEITCTGVTDNVICVASSRYNTDVIGIYYHTGNIVKVFCRNTSTGNLSDSLFSFVIYAGQ